MQEQPCCEFCKTLLLNEWGTCSCTKMAQFPGVSKTSQNPKENKRSSVIKHTSDFEYRFQKKMLSSLKKSSASALAQMESMIAQAYAKPSTSQLQGLNSETQKKRPSGEKITSKRMEYHPYVNKKSYERTSFEDRSRSTITSQTSTVIQVNLEKAETSGSKQETEKCVVEPMLSSKGERTVSKPAIQNLKESSATVMENMSFQFKEQIASSSYHLQILTQDSTITSSRKTSILCDYHPKLATPTKSLTVQCGSSMDSGSLHVPQANPEQPAATGSKCETKRIAGGLPGSSPQIQDTSTNSGKSSILCNYQPKLAAPTKSVTVQCRSSMDSGSLHAPQAIPEQPAATGSKRGTKRIAGSSLQIQDIETESFRKSSIRCDYYPKLGTPAKSVRVRCGFSMDSESLHAPQVNPKQPAATGSKHGIKKTAGRLPGSLLQIQGAAKSYRKTFTRNYRPKVVSGITKFLTVQCESSIDSGSLHAPQANPEQPAASGFKHETKLIAGILPGSSLQIQNTATKSSLKSSIRCDYRPKLGTPTKSVTVQCGSLTDSGSLHASQANPKQPEVSGSKCGTEKIAGGLPGSSQGSCTTPILVDLTKESPLECYCKRCNKFFGSYVNLDRHIDELVKDGAKNAMSHHHSPHYRRKEFFVCQVCQQRFDTISDLDNHLESHRAPTPYKCLYCGKKFNREKYLSKHEYTIHTKETIRRCLRCHERFLNDADLTNHPCDP